MVNTHFIIFIYNPCLILIYISTHCPFYNISFSVNATRDTYTLQAVPTGAQANDDCGTLTLNDEGVRGAAQAGCW